MAKKSETTTTDAAGFGSSPYPFARTIDEKRAEADKIRREEARKRRRMTNPHHGSERAGRPDLLAVPARYVEALAKIGLEAGWIRKEEWPEYQERGYRVATHQDIAAANGGDGNLRHDYQQDGATSHTSAVERREMLLVIAPKQWKEDRMKVEQHLARTQMAEDPFDDLKGSVMRGHFGAGNRRPDALEFTNDDEDDE